MRELHVFVDEPHVELGEVNVVGGVHVFVAKDHARENYLEGWLVLVRVFDRVPAHLGAE